MEIPFHPARVLLQDFTGVPAVVDLAAMRDAMKRLGGDPKRINPLIPADPSNFTDLGGGDGQMDMEASVFGTVAVGSRFGGWARARYGIQRQGSVTRRVAAPHELIAPVAAHTQVMWDPGDYLELELAPFVRLTPRFAFSARYRLYTKGKDSYSLTVTPDPEAAPLPPIELLNQETEATIHEVGFALTLSGLAAAREGKAWFPFEAYAAFYGALAGSGGQTPKVGRAQVVIGVAGQAHDFADLVLG